MMIALCDICGRDPVIGWIVTTVAVSVMNFFVMARWSICNR